jgi:DNA-directed RNA polymerase specialized sigma54-like protein
METLEEILSEIQNRTGGVGARTLRECLRLQLVHREKEKTPKSRNSRSA